jgi:hypothetical protein
MTDVTNAVRKACVDFLAGKGVVVEHPDDAICLARAALLCMGGGEHPIHNEAHALRLIGTFYQTLVNPSTTPKAEKAPWRGPLFGRRAAK